MWRAGNRPQRQQASPDRYHESLGICGRNLFGVEGALLLIDGVDQVCFGPLPTYLRRMPNDAVRPLPRRDDY